MPVDYSDPIGRVRKYIPDVREIDGEYIFSDEEIESFIEDQTLGIVDPTPVHILRAAAYAMIAIANDENLILKKITTEDEATDGPAVAKAMLASAQELLKRADAAELAIAGTEELIIVDYRPYPPRYEPLTAWRGPSYWGGYYSR